MSQNPTSSQLGPVPPSNGQNWLAVTRLPLDVIAASEFVSVPEATTKHVYINEFKIKTNDLDIENLILDYEDNALGLILQAVSHARRRWAVLKLAILYRIDQVEHGSHSILIAVSSHHSPRLPEFADFVGQFLASNIEQYWQKRNLYNAREVYLGFLETEIDAASSTAEIQGGTTSLAPNPATDLTKVAKSRFLAVAGDAQLGDRLSENFKYSGDNALLESQMLVKFIRDEKPPEVIQLERILAGAKIKAPANTTEFAKLVSEILKLKNYSIRLPDGEEARSLRVDRNGVLVLHCKSGSDRGFKNSKFELIPHVRASAKVISPKPT